MSYRLEPDESIVRGVRRIAREQIDKARVEIADDDLDVHATVHQIRKRAKKLRGLLRLVRPRPAGSIYRDENRRLRDAARTLSDVRDATSRLECLDRLAARFGDAEVVGDLRCELAERRNGMAAQRDVPRRIERFDHVLRDVRAATEHWTLEADGFDAIAGGLEKTCRRARAALDAALAEPTAELLHEWRKRVKYHWYHARLLERAWPEPMAVRIDALDRLADLLGDDHDLAVLRRTAVAREGTSPRTAALVALVGLRQGELRAAAFPLGRRLFADRPGARQRRLRTWWGSAAREPALVRALGRPLAEVEA